MERRLIVILGTTASGKGALARALAEEIGAGILSIDSMKVYRGMDVGTAKPSPDVRARIAHHLIDVVDPWESFSAARFVELADAAVYQVHKRGRPVVAVGGTILYFKAFYHGLFAGPAADAAFRAAIRQRAQTEGVEALHAELMRVDPQAAARIHRNDLRRIERALEVHYLTGRPISTLQEQWESESVRRPDWDWRLIVLRREREDNNRRINARVKRMVERGLVEEARRLWEDPRGLSEQARQAVGYRELFDCFADQSRDRKGADARDTETTAHRAVAHKGTAHRAAAQEGTGHGAVTHKVLEDAIEQIKIDTRRLAKQQRTWLKRLRGAQTIDVAGDAESFVPNVLDKL